MLQHNRIIKRPNLPESAVTEVIISESAGESIKKLESMGITCRQIKKEPKLPVPVASHSDLQILHLDNNVMFCHIDNFILLSNELNGFCLKTIPEEMGSKYPNDVRLNCAVIGNKLICNTKTVSKAIIEYAEKLEYQIINVNQGYTKCSICVVNENAIITDDKSIYTAAGNFLNDVLLIEKNSIRLEGYNYGFIGGCCGKTDRNKIFFNGAIESHSEHNKIIDFMSKNDVSITDIPNMPLTDIGGIIPLRESPDDHN